jgi:hypothetical protein
MARTKSNAFALTDAQFKGQWKDRAALANWLVQELDTAKGGRGAGEQEVKYNWAYYEQARLRGNSAPWPDAADLPSPYAPEYTDAVHARLMQVIFVEPVWTVEGWGESAKKAPFVEEFHQRAQEEERLQSFVDEWVLRGLVEGVGTLEISEAYEIQRERVQKRVAMQMDPATSQPIMGEDDQPLLQTDEAGDYVETDDMNVPSAEIELDEETPVRLGPDYDVVPYLDFFTLPAHARHRKQIWGYAKRFYRRVPQLLADVERGIYDKEAVEKVGTDNERTTSGGDAPVAPSPVSQDGMTAEKELFDLQFFGDLDGKGERWWRITLSKERTQILRLVPDDRTTRYFRFFPFPKPGTVDRGFSLIGNKLISVLEEDTAQRNMTADRMALVVGQPVKRRQGALWDPFEQPFGPRQVIDVRDMDEVQPMQGIADVPASVMQWRQHIRSDADRLVGQNDVAQGQISEEKRTLGEVQLVAGYAEVRTNIIIKRLQETLEELGQARHTIWKRTLQNNPKLPMGRALVLGREAQGVDVQGLASDGKVTADLLDGVFWFKPRGSVETADLNRQRADFNSMLQTLPALMQMNPAVAAIFQTIPAAKSLVETMLKVNRVQDRQSFLGSEADSVFDRMEAQQQVQNDPMMQIMQAVAGAGDGGAMPAGTPQAGPPQAGGPPMPPMGQGGL